MKQLPNHIEQVSPKWYKNTKTGKFIHAEKIDDWLDTYWSFRNLVSDAVNAKKKYNKNIKSAKKRWGI